ncbi:hypothetical protein FGO68_gene11860 [Halteria grandinella]|uniref:Ankyrin repeat protein n=1 Tax=Halteria grandinella TaxID=5974 RepID=A0A8J8NJI2_HALGN|nr:hypothetical protein FGO68_gene11860 [Halteria grandinella]
MCNSDSNSDELFPFYEENLLRVLGHLVRAEATPSFLQGAFKFGAPIVNQISPARDKWESLKISAFMQFAGAYDLSWYLRQSIEEEFTIVHYAANLGNFRLVNYFINELHFDVDFYQPPLHRLTILHVIAKFRTYTFTDDEKEEVRKIIAKSNNLLLRNNFGKTIVALAKSMHNSNEEFLREELKSAIMQKYRGVAFVVEQALKKKNVKINKFIVRDIYKYVDG